MASLAPVKVGVVLVVTSSVFDAPASEAAVRSGLEDVFVTASLLEGSLATITPARLLRRQSQKGLLRRLSIKVTL